MKFGSILKFELSSTYGLLKTLTLGLIIKVRMFPSSDREALPNPLVTVTLYDKHLFEDDEAVAMAVRPVMEEVTVTKGLGSASLSEDGNILT